MSVSPPSTSTSRPMWSTLARTRITPSSPTSIATTFLSRDFPIFSRNQATRREGTHGEAPAVPCEVLHYGCHYVLCNGLMVWRFRYWLGRHRTMHKGTVSRRVANLPEDVKNEPEDPDSRGDVVEIETWWQADGKIGTRHHWILKDLANGEVIGRTTRFHRSTELVDFVASSQQGQGSSVGWIQEEDRCGIRCGRECISSSPSSQSTASLCF